MQTNTIETTISKRNTQNQGDTSDAAIVNALQGSRIGGQEQVEGETSEAGDSPIYDVKTKIDDIPYE